ncbi:MAG: alanine dehydrogenase [Nitrososphaerota archaeon]|nr:alanine dehydrogenase [Candidatus Bathyarchaeota archaeon]MDW8023072.1 alanine dehydrogenase [Nitrososphaerota archaeon]
METLILTDGEVKELISMKEVMEWVELAFKEKGLKRVQMPAKVYLFYKKYNGDLRAMPSYLEELDISAVKVVNVHVDNKEKYGFPTIMAVVVLVDPKNGFPLAVMGGTTITEIRTGAAGGIAAKHLARKDSKIVALIGAGTQAKTQLEGLLEVYKKFEEVRVWSRSRETRERFLAEAKQTYGRSCKFVPAVEVRDAVKGADIVVTITPSRKPLVMGDVVSPGMHFNCIGADAPGKEELDPAILKRAKIVVDDWEQASHSGEINVPLSLGIITKENVWAEMGEIVAGLKPGREKPDEVTVFTSTGLAIQDAVTAKLVYDKAIKKGVGRFVKIT